MDPNKPHCLILPYPNQGHINPLLQFSKRLIRRNLTITLALTKFTLKSIPTPSYPSLSLRHISDGCDDRGRHQVDTVDEYQARFELFGRETLAELIRDLADSGRPVDCVVYDPFLSWALDVAKGFGLLAAAFFTQSCAVASVYHRVRCGELKLPLCGNGAVELPGLPPLRPEEMPSFINVAGSYPRVFKMLTDQFTDLGRADWVFINTFYALEEEVIQGLSSSWQMKAIGPTLPSMYLDKRVQEDKEYNLSLFEPATNTCINWLNQKDSKSVIYVSFGSLAKLSMEQTQEVAMALMNSNKHFLWVARSAEEVTLPGHFLSSGKGLVVSWCPQLQVLAHDAVGCFVTHCGWNSTLEGLSLGVPMVAMPQWTDQCTNAKFIRDIWKVGIWAHADDKGLVREEEIVHCIKQVMEGDDGEEIRANASNWKELACKAVDEGGTSDKNIEEFVDTLKSLSKGAKS